MSPRCGWSIWLTGCVSAAKLNRIAASFALRYIGNCPYERSVFLCWHSGVNDDRGLLANHLRYDRVVRLELTYDRSNKLLRREYPNGKIAFSIRKLRLCFGFDNSCHATN